MGKKAISMLKRKANAPSSTQEANQVPITQAYNAANAGTTVIEILPPPLPLKVTQALGADASEDDEYDIEANIKASKTQRLTP